MSSRKISFIAIGLRGDVQPCVVLGSRLKQEGHRVTIATHTNFEEMVRAYGLDYISIAGDSREILSANQQVFDLRRQGLRVVRAFRDTVLPYARQTLIDYWEIGRQADLVLFNMFGWPTYQIAEKLPVATVFTSVFPLTRTSAYPTLALPFRASPGRWYNRLTHFLFERVAWLAFGPVINQWREETLTLPPLRWPGFIEDFYRKEIPVLYAYSPAISPAPPNWPANYHVTGYWFCDKPPDWEPPQALVDFIADGPPPVYIGFGSMNCETDHDMIDLIREALRLSGQRAVVSRGWSELSLETGLFEDNIFAIGSVPHAWLFPQMAAVVHHGGCGTTTAGLRAGVPTIITPLFVDQPFWGHRIAELGVGPASVPYKRLTAKKLADAIRQAVSDEAMKIRAIELAAAINAEAGCDEAIRIIRNLLGED
ncbi:MAG: glycosyltransferase family 1 protein [Anaerolineae bacterium]|nr:glycosyltransferase family 1 protein [Anaerolineae bacterium]